MNKINMKTPIKTQLIQMHAVYIHSFIDRCSRRCSTGLIVACLKINLFSLVYNLLNL